MDIRIRRAYDDPGKADGYRVLIDRLWPRGIKKADLKLDDWVKDLAPSDGLRKWFGHDPAKWDGFQEKYRAELKERAEALDSLVTRVKEGRVTLIYGAKDEEHNNAVVLREVLKDGAG